MNKLICFFSMTCMLVYCVYAVPIPLPEKTNNPWPDDYTSISAMKNYKQWGSYNVHDPSCKLFGDTYYMYSTDAIYGENREEIESSHLPFGYIQVRKSKDLIHWEFTGWVFEEIPQEAKAWVLEKSGGEGATNIWAPYITEYKGRYRLYYCVSAFARQTSYIGLAESDSPEGPWELKDCVVKTQTGDEMNAIDPSVVTNPDTGEQWMHYGSYFGGLHCVRLNPETGLTFRESDQGHLVARRFNGKKNNIEAPEIIYNPDLKQYFLFVSYDPLMTTYNIRAGRADSPEGPFFDFFGNNMYDETDNYPVLTCPYRFQNHSGWAGTGHCCVFRDSTGNYFMAHQARLSPENHLMDLHVRKIFWTNSGWPVVSPERYAGTPEKQIIQPCLTGDWEVIILRATAPERELIAGQILWGENQLQEPEKNESVLLSLNDDFSFTLGNQKGTWKWENNLIYLDGQDMTVDLQVFAGQDWENEKQTILFTGINKQGYSVWGKKVK